MLQRDCILLAVVGGCVVAHSAIAQPLPTPQQLNRLDRDIAPTNSHDFFRQGRVQLEREIQLLERAQLAPSAAPKDTIDSPSVLRIDPATRCSDPRFLNDNRRDAVKE